MMLSGSKISNTWSPYGYYDSHEEDMPVCEKCGMTFDDSDLNDDGLCDECAELVDEEE